MRITKKVKYLQNQDFFQLFNQFIKDSTKGTRIKADGKKIRSSTINNYINLQKQINGFVNDTGYTIKLYLTNHLTDKEKIQANAYNKKFFIDFTNYLYIKKDFYDNYVGLIIKGLRTFYNYLNTELGIYVGEFHKKFYVPSEDIDIVVLSPEQINFLISDKNLNTILPEHLHKVKDIFVFGCTVALRYSDLMKLKPENLKLYNNTYYLKVTSIKTNTNTRIKLPNYAVDILKKYNKKQKYLLPQISNAWLNKCLKELANYLNFNQPLIKYRTKRGVKCTVYKNKLKRQHYTLADHISTHTMRRTAITTMLRLGMPDQLVRKISGHGPTSKEFFKYVEFAQNYMDEHTDLVFEKLMSLEPIKNVKDFGL